MQINRCPKCGREPSEIGTFNPASGKGYEIECYDCGLHTGTFAYYEDAVEKWNEMTKGTNK